MIVVPHRFLMGASIPILSSGQLPRQIGETVWAGAGLASNRRLGSALESVGRHGADGRSHAGAGARM